MNNITVRSDEYNRLVARITEIEQIDLRGGVTISEWREWRELRTALVQAVAAQPQDDQDREDVIAMLRNAGATQ